MKVKDSCLILIPAYNSANSLKSLILEISEKAQGQKILVVDDGSTDNTQETLMQLGVESLRQPANLGKGTALMRGIAWARQNSFHWVLAMDADGQHSPEDMPSFLEIISPPPKTWILGVRKIAGTSMPWHRRFSNWLTSKSISQLAGKSIRDCQSGYRLYPTDISQSPYFPLSGRFEWEAHVLVVAARLGYEFREVSISTLYSSEGSHIRLFTDTLRFILMFMRLLLKDFK